MFLVDWWNSLGIAAQVFYCVAIPATLILLIQTVLMFIGLGNDADGVGDGAAEDIGDATPDDIADTPEIEDVSELADFKIFTLRGIIAFFVVFGWVGVAMDAAGAQLFVTIPISIVCGIAIMILLAIMMRAVMKLRGDGNTDNRNAIGTAGRVQLVIPPARTGSGKVHVMLQGSYVERDAVTDDNEAIPTGAEIIVIGVSGQTDLVVKRK